MTKGGQSTSSDTMLAMVKNFPCTCSDLEYAEAASFGPLFTTPAPGAGAAADAGAGADSVADGAGVFRGVRSALGLRAEGGGVSASGSCTPALLARERVRGPSPVAAQRVLIPLLDPALTCSRRQEGQGTGMDRAWEVYVSS